MTTCRMISTMFLSRHSALLVLLGAASLVQSNAFTVRPFAARQNSAVLAPRLTFFLERTSSADGETATSPAPVLNGKMVLPMKVMTSGLKDHKVAAVYAVLNSNYKRKSGDGWEHVEFVSVSTDLEESLQALLEDQGKETVAHVRALSFSFPQKDAMEQVASQWRDQVKEAGGSLKEWNIEQELDDDDEDWLMETPPPPPSTTVNDNPEGIISPFAASGASVESENGQQLEFTAENVDQVLNEVRPYLIRDGGNVAVDSVDEEKKNVYLILEGACGSCSSSTVTMSMGIERVLKENFPDLNEVIEVEDPNAEPEPTELTWKAVEEEVNRIKPAIIAMGGAVELLKVEPTGEVELEFRGGEKLKQGLELAVKDVSFVTQVKFVCK